MFLISYTFPFAETSCSLHLPLLPNLLFRCSHYSIISLFLLLIWKMALFFMSKRLANPDVFRFLGSLIHTLLKKKGRKGLLLKSSDFDCGQKENRSALLLIQAGYQGLICCYCWWWSGTATLALTDNCILLLSFFFCCRFRIQYLTTYQLFSSCESLGKFVSLSFHFLS